MPYPIADFPTKVWDGVTPNPWRFSRADFVDPTADDWDQVVAELIAMQESILVGASLTAAHTALTNSTGGTTDDTLEDVSTAVTGVDGTGSNAASKADVDSRLTTINNNFAEVYELTDNLRTRVNELETQLITFGLLS